MSEDWYAPNQQAVRGDESGPEEEGEGGSERVDPEPLEETVERPLDSMTKAELLQVAELQGVEVDESWTKAEIREAIGD
jgi:hypothetical protein